jgi:hypothetical protein
MPVRIFQITGFALWLTGLPLLIWGLVRAAAYPIQVGGTLLLAALIIATIHECSILKIIRTD